MICSHGAEGLTCASTWGRHESLELSHALSHASHVPQELYHTEANNHGDVKAARIKEVLESIAETGTYQHTFEELQHGTPSRTADPCCITNMLLRHYTALTPPLASMHLVSVASTILLDCPNSMKYGTLQQGAGLQV